MVEQSTVQFTIETVDDKGRTHREALVIEVGDCPRPEGTITEIDLVVFHLQAVFSSGGAYGVYGKGEGLQMAVERPWQFFGEEEMFPDIFSKAAALAECIVQDHGQGLVDGSKRTAVMSTSYLLEQLGYRLAASDAATEKAILDLTTHKITREDYAQWLRSHAKPKRLPTLKQLLNQHLHELEWVYNPYRGHRYWRDPLIGEWKTDAEALATCSQRTSNPLWKLLYRLLGRSLFKS